jgi:uncharacterized protein YceK
MKRHILLGMGLAVLLGGCGSIADIAENQRIYGGIQADVRLIGDPYLPKTSPPEYFFPLVLFGLLDMPLSLVMDTVFLPVTVIIALSSDDKTKR